MSRRFTIKDLEERQAAGMIKGFTEIAKPPTKPTAAKSGAGRANKQWIHDQLQVWCDDKSFLLIREHTFSNDRNWRLDWAVFDGRKKVVAVEYEGIFSKKSRHTTHAGFTEDSDKYRAAALEGWKVLRYTAKNYKNIVDDLKKLV